MNKTIQEYEEKRVGQGTVGEFLGVGALKQAKRNLEYMGMVQLPQLRVSITFNIQASSRKLM